MAVKSFATSVSKSVLFVLLGSILLILAGCSRYWYQPGVSFDKAAQDWEDCMEEMRKRSTLDNRWSDYPVEFEEACMRQKGYELYWEHDLPLLVKRQDPETVDIYIYGVAGELTEENMQENSGSILNNGQTPSLLEK